MNLLKPLRHGLKKGTSSTTALCSTLAMWCLFPGHRFYLLTFVYKDHSSDLNIFDYQTFKQVRMRLVDEDSENDLHLVPGSHGMNVPSACIVVIIAGCRFT